MTVLDTLNFVAFNSLKTSNPIGVRRRKLVAKIDKGKNAIELASEAGVADILANVREPAELGELGALIEKQAQFGRRVT